MNVKRRKGLACSSPLDPDMASRQELKGNVYNIFPYIYDPKNRAFTLPGVIDATFFPITSKDMVKFSSDVWKAYIIHEVGHIILRSAMITCEERAVAAKLLGMAVHFLYHPDVQLLIPSFTLVEPAGKTFDLQKLADRLEMLFEARHAVHEIIACTLQVYIKDWDRDKAKRLIRKFIADDLLDEKALDGFLGVFEKFGPMVACAVGQYALNAVGLTQRIVLERFKRATEVACTFRPKDHKEPTSPTVDFLKFRCHLQSNLPDYNMAHCPLVGACLHRTLDSWVESLKYGDSVHPLGAKAAQDVYMYSAYRMRQTRCDRDEQLARRASPFSDSWLEIIGWFDNEILPLAAHVAQDPIVGIVRDVTVLHLIEHENCDYKYTIGVPHAEKEKPLWEISKETFLTYWFEASLQQMMCGEGPLCLCYPHQPADCPHRQILQHIWDRTHPDPEWESNWKQPNKKPQCIE